MLRSGEFLHGEGVWRGVGEERGEVGKGRYPYMAVAVRVGQGEGRGEGGMSIYYSPRVFIGAAAWMLVITSGRDINYRNS